MSPPKTPKAILGQHIFAYNNLRTNQVIYSLTRSLKNNASLRQMPFLGKKSVPASLRKDLWQPFATLSFPWPDQGLKAFHKLREYRMAHEFSSPDSLFASTTQPGSLIPKKERGKLLMNQKANSIADMAAVLLARDTALATALAREEQAALEDGALKKVPRGGRSRKERRLTGGAVQVPAKGKEEVLRERELQRQPVTIRWANLLDAEFAEKWPESVLHDVLGFARHTAPNPRRTPLLHDGEGKGVELRETAG
ncbi:MAG: hypothetical protein M1829_004517 [Trizodia sp. TS-e1964]|nr:MAG: hypothetical protein M1829_004517 [Trizodia sp. TS-e1964]